MYQVFYPMARRPIRHMLYANISQGAQGMNLANKEEDRRVRAALRVLTVDADNGPDPKDELLLRTSVELSGELPVIAHEILTRALERRRALRKQRHVERRC